VVNRYYDPSTAEFLSIDPKVAETGQPYSFTADDPLNASDPLGLMVDGQYMVAGNSARSNKLAGDRDFNDLVNGRLHDEVTWQKRANQGNLLTLVAKHWRGEVKILGAVAAVTAIVATLGAAALPETELGVALETTSTVSSAVAGGADAPGCFSGSGTSRLTSCIGAASGGLGALGGVALRGAEWATQLKPILFGETGLLAGFGDWASAVNQSRGQS
jgi:hypothetical protein